MLSTTTERVRPAVRPQRPPGRRQSPRTRRPDAPASVQANTNPSLGARTGETLTPGSIGARALGRYVGLETGIARGILAVTGSDASILVIDAVAGSLQDARLVARIAPEEPRENARIVCELYLADETRGLCRPLSAEDLDPPGTASVPPAGAASLDEVAVIECDARLYRIRTIAADERPCELRWTSSPAGAADGVFERLTLRDVVARLEDYEPARTITGHALAAHAELHGVSTVLLRCELERLEASRIVLNRGLREGVDRAVAGGLTMSEIAKRCRRVKRDRRGNVSGETSWLGRRIGRLPEAGRAQPTPWVHSSTLALIAREGLGVNPNEVEL